MSEHFDRAIADWRDAREEYDRFLDAQYERAAEACRDALLNERGRRAGISARSLFMGNAIRANAYASAELIEWWQEHPRTPFVAFERRWLADRDAEHAADILARALNDTEPW